MFSYCLRELVFYHHSLTWTIPADTLLSRQRTRVTLRAVSVGVRFRLPKRGWVSRSVWVRVVLLLLLRQFLFGHSQRVVHPKVIDDDGDRHGNGQDPGQRAQGPHHHAQPRLRVHVSVAQCRHGNHCPPEADGDVLEVGVVGARGVVGLGPDALGVVNHGGEDENTQSQEDDEEEELIDTGPQRVSQHAQADKVSRQFEDPEDPDEPHHSEEAQHVTGSFGWQTAQAHLQVEGQNGHKVNDVEWVPDEDHLARAADDTHQEFKREPDHTDALHHGEDGLGHHLPPLHAVCDVAHENLLRAVLKFIEGLVCLQAESGDGHQDEEERGKGNSLKETR